MQEHKHQQRKYHREPVCASALTERERQILAAYAAGLPRAEIAREVGLAGRTVGAYLTTVKEKLGARNLVHAAALGAAASDP